MAIALGLLMIGVMLGAPGAVTAAARDALRVWGLDVAPSLFPYMVFCRLIASRLRQSGMPAMPAAALLGMLGGSPSGAAVVSVYGPGREFEPPADAHAGRLHGNHQPHVSVEHDPGLAWKRADLPSADGGPWGWSPVCMGCCGGFDRESPGARTQAAHPLQDSASGDPIAESVQSILGVGGCIVFFSVLAGMRPRSAAGASRRLRCADSCRAGNCRRDACALHSPSSSDVARGDHGGRLRVQRAFHPDAEPALSSSAGREPASPDRLWACARRRRGRSDVGDARDIPLSEQGAQAVKRMPLHA